MRLSPFPRPHKIEQIDVLGPFYAQIDKLLFGMIAAAMSDEATASLPGVRTFRQLLPHGNLADSDPDPAKNDRYRWVVGEVTRIWVTKYAREDRDHIVRWNKELINAEWVRKLRSQAIEIDLATGQPTGKVFD